MRQAIRIDITLQSAIFAALREDHRDWLNFCGMAGGGFSCRECINRGEGRMRVLTGRLKTTGNIEVARPVTPSASP